MPRSVIALLLLACCGSAASADTKPPGTAGLSARVAVSGTTSALGAGQEAYAAQPTVSVTFTMPSFSCASTSDAEWLLPGIWIFDTSGNLVAQVDVNFNCNSGTKVQQSVICIAGYPCDTSLHPLPGDVMEAVFWQPSAKALGRIYDRTQHTQAQAEGYPGSYSFYVFLGDAGPSAFGAPAVPTFTRVVFSIATLNGQYISDWSPTRLNLKTFADVQIKSGAAKTTSFTTKFVHN